MSIKSSIILSISLIVSVSIHSYLKRVPNDTFQFSNVIFNSGVKISVPDMKNATVEIYDNFIVINRGKGNVSTLMPIDTIRALDYKDN